MTNKLSLCVFIWLLLAAELALVLLYLAHLAHYLLLNLVFLDG
jgi:hypothetical protein